MPAVLGPARALDNNGIGCQFAYWYYAQHQVKAYACKTPIALKTASARRARARFTQHLGRFYWKPLFCHRAYFVGSVGGATLETVRAYVDAQGSEEHARNKGKAL